MKKSCPICGKLLGKNRMLVHIKKAHDGYKGIKEASSVIKASKMIQIKPKQKFISCPHCNKKIVEKCFRTHLKEWHINEYERDYPLSAQQKLAKALKSERGVASNDIMNTRCVVSGGGIGVGKGKK